ncbi:MAG: hypothetical protein HYZ54_06000 [Ignavibacteriae bacterium]|nr:hypothetical protein [Ignavibacteriota bacterium]
MCFSATASFGAGVVLSAISYATTKKAQSPSQFVFASIPLIFCIQQISEGFLWLALTDTAFLPLKYSTMYVFLIFAQIVWPTWIPLSIFILEKNSKRKKILKLFVGIGALVSLYLGYCMVTNTVDAKIIGYHVSYEQDYPLAFQFTSGLLYIVATILPSLFSSIKKMKILGAAIFISYFMTRMFYEDYIISVWCFFATVISLVVLAIMYEVKKIKIESPSLMRDLQYLVHNK